MRYDGSHAALKELGWINNNIGPREAANTRKRDPGSCGQLLQQFLPLARERRVRLAERLHALDDGALAVGGGLGAERLHDLRQLEDAEQPLGERLGEGRPREREQPRDAAAHLGAATVRSRGAQVGVGSGPRAELSSFELVELI